MDMEKPINRKMCMFDNDLIDFVQPNVNIVEMKDE